MKKIMIMIMLFCVCLSFEANAAKQSIDLQGKWRFKTDRENKGVTEKWYVSTTWEDNIQLPGSMPENLKGDIPGLKTQWTGSLYDSSFYYRSDWEKFRQERQVKFPFFLTPDRHYIGMAWYQKEVIVPKDWRSQRITLFIERPHIETQIWVDGRYAGKDSSLCVPHIFDLSDLLTPGRHLLTVCVDNRIKAVNVGPDSHSITDQTQGNWNGMVGKLLLEASPKTYFENIQVYPHLSDKTALVKIHLNNDGKKALKGNLLLSASSFNTEIDHSTGEVSREITLSPGGVDAEVVLPFGEGMQTWDEFSPALYRLNARFVVSGKDLAVDSVSFGMREISIDGRWIYINGRKTLMRGTVENCCFPLTGYAPMDVASWERVFRICKNYGLNHMRFHSFCPPEAAFIAADLVGMYLQPEGPSWPNHGSSLGDKKPIDKYLLDETIRMSKVYGNYASFCMLACGNEPRGRWVAWVTDFVNFWKATDSRRIYTGASVGGGWDWQPASQYHVKAGARGLNWKNTRPESQSDFREQISFMKGHEIKEPFISHETGQWCVFPNFDEIKKYTGVNKAKNFEIFQETLANHDMAFLGHDFMMASGKLQWLCYKNEIEKTLRTPDYAGFQLLALNDYSGQGTALEGVLDVFWDEKGYGDAASFRTFCAPTVPLIRTEKFVYQSNESLQAAVEIAHFGAQPMTAVAPCWTLKDANGTICWQGTLPEVDEIPIGNGFSLGKITVDWSFVKKAGKYSLDVSLPCTDIHNNWDFYVYPAAPVIPAEGKVLVTSDLNEETINYLEEGGDVLLLAAGKIEYGREISQQFLPVFWNTSWFKMRPPHTTGILVNPYHPVFRDFPTDYYSDFQWWELVNNAQVMQLTDFPQGFQPLIQSIDTWFLSRKIGMLIEAKVGKGRIMVCSADLTGNWEERPAARQLYISVLNYMQSIYFRPEYQVDIERVQDLFTKKTTVYDTHTKAHPDELKPGYNNK